jgi:hypothetical protein
MFPKHIYTPGEPVPDGSYYLKIVNTNLSNWGYGTAKLVSVSVATGEDEVDPGEGEDEPGEGEDEPGEGEEALFGFVDDMSQGLGLVYKSDKFKVASMPTTEAQWGGIEYGLCNDNAKSAYLIYQFDEPIRDFEIVFFNYLSSGSDLFKLSAFVSADDQTYAEVALNTDNQDNSKVAMFPKHIYTPGELVPDGSYYLKIVSSNLSNWGYGTAKLVKVSVATGEDEDESDEEEPGEGETPSHFVDDMSHGLDLAYKSDKFKIASMPASEPQWEGIEHGLCNDNAKTAYLIYRFDKPIRDFEIDYFNYRYSGNFLFEVKAYVSADDTTYAEVGVSTDTPGDSAAMFPRQVITPADSIPDGSYYLKIVNTNLSNWGYGTAKLVKISVTTGEGDEEPGEEEPGEGGEDPEAAPEGKRLVLTPLDDGSWDNKKIFKDIQPLVIGETYRLSLYAKSDPSGAKLGTYVGQGGASLLPDFQITNLANDWTPYEFTFVADATQLTLRLFAQGDGTNAGKRIFVDNVEFESVSDGASAFSSDFEDGLTGWSVQNSSDGNWIAVDEDEDEPATDPDAAPAGNVLVLSPLDDGSWDNKKIFKDIQPLVIGETYRLSLFAKSDPSGAKLGTYVGQGGASLLPDFHITNLPSGPRLKSFPP